MPCELKRSTLSPQIGLHLLNSTMSAPSSHEKTLSTYVADTILCPSFARLGSMPAALDTIFSYLRQIYGPTVQSCVIHFNDTTMYTLFDSTFEQLRDQRRSDGRDDYNYFSFVLGVNQDADGDASGSDDDKHIVVRLVYCLTRDKIAMLANKARRREIVRPFSTTSLQWLPVDRRPKSSSPSPSSVTLVDVDENVTGNDKETMGDNNSIDSRIVNSELTWQRELLLKSLSTQTAQLVALLDNKRDVNGRDECLQLSKVAQLIYDILCVVQATWSEPELKLLLLTTLSPSRMFAVMDAAFTIVLQHFAILIAQDSMSVFVAPNVSSIAMDTLDERVTQVLTSAGFTDNVVSLDGFDVELMRWLIASPTHYDYFRTLNAFKTSVYGDQYTKDATVVDSFVCEWSKTCTTSQGGSKCQTSNQRRERPVVKLDFFYPLSFRQLCLNAAQNDDDFTLVHWNRVDQSAQIVLSDRFYATEPTPFPLTTRLVVYS